MHVCIDLTCKSDAPDASNAFGVNVPLCEAPIKYSEILSSTLTTQTDLTTRANMVPLPGAYRCTEPARDLFQLNHALSACARARVYVHVCIGMCNLPW